MNTQYITVRIGPYGPPVRARLIERTDTHTLLGFTDNDSGHEYFTRWYANERITSLHPSINQSINQSRNCHEYT